MQSNLQRKVQQSVKKEISKIVYRVGWVSLLNDFSSEMIYPLLPLFLSGVLGVGAAGLGLIEGLAEAAASLLKIVSGRWSDRTGRRKPFVILGYGLATMSRPLMALAPSWGAVLSIRLADRIGKGLRSAPRDALIADVTSPERRGVAYGIHRTFDNVGAVVGPLVAGLLLSGFTLPLRTIFALAAVPAVFAFLLLWLWVPETGHGPSLGATRAESVVTKPGSLGADYWKFLVAVFIFTLGNSTDAFLILRLSKVGVSASWIAVLWAIHNGVKVACGYWGGRLGDRMGHQVTLIVGWIYYALIYGAFSIAHSPTALIVVFLAYGVFFALTEPAERAWISLVAPPELRGTAFGYFHLVVGLGVLPASLLFGWIWEKGSPELAFRVGAILALGAAAGVAGLMFTSKPAARSVTS